MDKAQAMRQCIRDNRFLLDEETSKEEAEACIRIFQDRQQFKTSSRFRLKDLAPEIAVTIAKSVGGEAEAIAERLRKSRLLREALNDAEILAISKKFGSLVRPLVSSEDLGRMKHDEYLAAISERIREKVELEAQAKFDQKKMEADNLLAQLQKKQEELAAFETSLNEPIREVKMGAPAPGVAPTKANLDWWRDFGLARNPFPNTKGLKGFQPEEYDQVVVQTDFVANYGAALRAPESALFGNTLLILGEYGSGKSTVMQYLGHVAGRQGIFPFDISLAPGPTMSEIMRKFEMRLCEAVGRAHSKFTGGTSIHPGGNHDYLSAIADMLLDLQGSSEKSGTGFLGLIDGLHKGDDYREAVFSFLQQLQTVNEYFDSRGVRIGFLLAGSKLWERDIGTRKSFSGSFQKRDVIPPLREQEAIRAVENRFQACGIQEAGGSLDLASLRAIHKELSKRSEGALTFRLFLEEVRSRMEAGETDGNEKVYLALGPTIVRRVQEFTAKSRIAENWAIIAPTLTNRDEAARIRRICRSIFQTRGTSETDGIFLGNRSIFRQLWKAHLIVQHRHDRSFKWVLSNDFLGFLAEVFDSFGLAPRDAITAMTTPLEQAKEAESDVIFSDLISRATDLRVNLKDNWPSLSDASERLANVLTGLSKSFENETARHEQVKHAAVQGGYALAEATLGRRPSLERLWNDLHQGWLRPESLATLSQFADGRRSVPSNHEEMYQELHHFKTALGELFGMVEDCARGEHHVPLCKRALAHDDKQKLHDVRLAISEGRLQKAAEISLALLEARIRTTAFIVLRVRAGNSYQQLLPNDLQLRLSDLKPRGNNALRRDVAANVLYELSRSDYAKFLLRAPLDRFAIAGGSSRDDLRLMQGELEGLLDLDNRLQHREKADYFREKGDVIVRLLIQLPRLLLMLNTMMQGMLTAKREIETNPAGNLTEFHFSIQADTRCTVKLPPVELKELQETFMELLKAGPVEILDEFWYSIHPKAAPEHHAAAVASLLEEGYAAVNWSRMQIELKI